ncbi:MAG TPA: ABC transporter ATP-binding protein [Bacteroidota bacterium]|nr:ABC transporter ATP-binding protein [Bacteroidota bacterium]
MTSDANDPVLVVRALAKRYGSLVAVDGISFEVGKKEIFGILGPNGAGKTTTLECIETLRPFDEGSITVGGIDVRDRPDDVKRIIGVQLQSSSFFDRLRLDELLDLFGTLYGRTVDPIALLKEVELHDRANAMVTELSGGQKQRFSIAAALVNDPLVLFLDEPTTGLDPQARRHLWGIVKRIREEGTTVVLTTHYMDEAEELCDRVAIMDHGKIATMDNPHALIDQLLQNGFSSTRVQRMATLEDVFLNLTGHTLRDE